MRRVAADFGPIPEYAGESLDRVAKLTEADYPLDGKDCQTLIPSPLYFQAHCESTVISSLTFQKFQKDVKDETDILLQWQNCSKLWKKNKNVILYQF